MDGIFGVGVAEVVIVGLALFVIGGPKNTAKWAHQLGHMIYQVRQYWAQIMAEIEADIGPEGKEIVDAARELGKGAKQVSNMTPQKRLLGETMNAVKAAVDVDANTKDVEKPSNGAADQLSLDSQELNIDEITEKPASSETKYTAWTPPNNN